MWFFWLVDDGIELIFVGCVNVLFLEISDVVVYCIIIVLDWSFGFGFKNGGKLFNCGFIKCLIWRFEMFVSFVIFIFKKFIVNVIGWLWKLLFEIIFFLLLKISGLFVVVFILIFNFFFI